MSRRGRDNLGGIGGSLADKVVSSRPIRTAPASYVVAGSAFVGFQGTGSQCPAGQPSGELIALKVTGGDRPALTTAWCGIVTTTDGHSEPNRLHAFKGDTGESLFTGGSPSEAMTGLHHFQSLIAANERRPRGAGLSQG